MSLLSTFAVLAGAFYGGAPVAIRYAVKMHPKPDYQALRPEELPPEVWRYLSGTVEKLQAMGFTPGAYVTLSDSPSRTYLVLLQNREAGDRAMVTAMFGRSVDGWKLFSCHLEFSTRYDDERCFNTNNASALGAFAPGPKDVTTRLPGVNNSLRLYRIHRRILAAHPGGRPVVYEDGEALAYITGIFRRSYEEQASLGMVYLDARAGRYRPTWKGAFRMTWGLIWPVSSVRRYQIRRDARALLASFPDKEDPPTT
jgi:hypothetical protein